MLLLVLAGCGSSSGYEEARRYAAGKLQLPESTLRVTARTDLTTSQTEFFLVTRETGKPLTVIVRDGEKPFDGETPGGFDRVARDEDATRRLTKLGAERVALWFSAFDLRTCGPPAAESAHFASVETLASGVRIRYPFLVPGGTRGCIVELAGDGTLRAARAEELTASTGAAGRRWASAAKN